MQRILTLILLLTVSIVNFYGQARIAIINDKDGYVNVRKEPNIKSDVIYKLNNTEVFEIDIEDIEFNSGWIKIWIPKNRFSISDGKSESCKISGYVHKSRIKLIDNLETIKKPKVILGFEIIKANTKKVYNEKYHTINGFYVYGLYLPLSKSFEVKNLYVEWNGERIEQNQKFYQDLYQVIYAKGYYNSTNKNFKTYKNGITYYIKQDCGDGEGFYGIIWVIQERKIIQRMVVELT